MRPWARAHGNRSRRSCAGGTSARFNEAVGSCPRKRALAISMPVLENCFNEAVGSCPRKLPELQTDLVAVPGFNEAVGSCPRKLLPNPEVALTLPSFNEAVGSCPRKPDPAERQVLTHRASMRPWARAHGNSRFRTSTLSTNQSSVRETVGPYYRSTSSQPLSLAPRSSMPSLSRAAATLLAPANRSQSSSVFKDPRGAHSTSARCSLRMYGRPSDSIRSTASPFSGPRSMNRT